MIEFMKIMVCVSVYVTAVCILTVFIKALCGRKS